MICPKCGTQNVEGSKFCIKCGNSFASVQPINNVNSVLMQGQGSVQPMQQPMNNQPSQNIQMQQPMYNQPNQNIQMQQPMYNQPVQNVGIQQPVNNGNASATTLNYFKYMATAFLKPIKCFKEEKPKLDNVKNSLLLTLIITVIMIVIHLISIVISTVRHTSWITGTTTWEWDNLEYIEWFKVIGGSILIYAGIIFVVALVFYLGSLIVKKQLSFFKSLSISATAVIPTVVGMMILSPLVGMIWDPLAIISSAVGIIYSLIILYELMNGELQLEGDKKIYFNLVCFGILIAIAYFVLTRILMDSISGGLEDLWEIFE